MKNIQAVILSSSNPAILSAGLDLTELYNPDIKRLPKFWNSFQQVFLDLYGSRLAIIGAIEGHAPAAGCMLAMACDYRIMAESQGKKSGTIGLNESQFGILAPPWLGQLMIRTIGFRKAEEALCLGTLFKPEDALKIGLVDKVVQSDIVLKTSYEVAKQFTKIPSQARFGSKMLARKPYLDELISTREADTSYFCKFIQNNAVQHGLGIYLEKLKQKH
jgi:3,2-trans-enoyl-CoA isomerase